MFAHSKSSQDGGCAYLYIFIAFILCSPPAPNVDGKKNVFAKSSYFLNFHIFGWFHFIPFLCER